MMRAPDNNDASLAVLVGGALALGGAVVIAALVALAIMLL